VCVCLCIKSRQAVQDMLQQGQTLRRKEAVTSDTENVASSSDEDDGEQMIHESTSRKRTLEDMEGSFSEDEKDEEMEKIAEPEADYIDDKAAKDLADSDQRGSRKSRKAPPGNLQINPSQYLVVETERPNNDGEAKVALAFAGDDDAVAEFAAEKQKVIERERPKDIDLRLPGWGEWSGPGIKQSRRRRKRLAIPYSHCSLCD